MFQILFSWYGIQNRNIFLQHRETNLPVSVLSDIVINFTKKFRFYDNATVCQICLNSCFKNYLNIHARVWSITGNFYGIFSYRNKCYVEIYCSLFYSHSNLQLRSIFQVKIKFSLMNLLYNCFFEIYTTIFINNFLHTLWLRILERKINEIKMLQLSFRKWLLNWIENTLQFLIGWLYVYFFRQHG